MPPPPNPNRWLKLVDLIQFMWDNGKNPTELGWTVLFIIPKDSTDTWRIGMLEVMWKVVEGLIYNHVKAAVKFHYVLHGFHAGRGAATAIMELKIAQDLESVYQDPSLWFSLI